MHFQKEFEPICKWAGMIIYLPEDIDAIAILGIHKQSMWET